MATVAILGAGPLGGSAAFALASAGACRRIVIVDEAGGIAAGKALDVAQAGPLTGSDTGLSGSDRLEEAAGADLVVVADRAGGGEWQGEAGLAQLARLVQVCSGAVIVLAGASQAWLAERAVVELGVAPRHVAGSAPLALEGGCRAMAALAAGASPIDVALGVVGRPPRTWLPVWEQATVAARPLEQLLDAPAVRALEARCQVLWPPGVQALASAAAAVAVAWLTRSRRALTCLAVLPPDGHALAVPVSFSSGLAEPARLVLPPRVRSALGLAETRA
jgi:malate/lactate dehydrogenase